MGVPFLALAAIFLAALTTSASAKEVATNSFYVKIHADPSQPDLAHKIARRNGFHNLGPVLSSSHEFHFVHNGLPHARSKRSVGHLRLLKADPHVDHAVQQTGFLRVKRGYGMPKAGLDSDDLALTASKKSPWVSLREALDGGLQVAPEPVEEDFDSHVVHDEGFFNRMQYSANHRDEKRGYNSLKVENLVDLPPQSDPTDPLFQHQWYLKNTGQNGGKPKLDLNVAAAWAQGITGKNITTAIMDDGVDYMHPDLINNYNARASYDFSSNDSMVAGIRMLDQPYMTDLIEANSMGHEPNLIDIYSASWGPTDDGRTVDGPRNATMRAIVRGVNEGRHGLGNIYVWASGDGGEDDDCNCDGYAASMGTISINSAINTGENAHYDESCHPLWHQHSLMAPKILTLEWQQLICMGNVPELTLEPLPLPRKLQECLR